MIVDSRLPEVKCTARNVDASRSLDAIDNQWLPVCAAHDGEEWKVMSLRVETGLGIRPLAGVVLLLVALLSIASPLPGAQTKSLPALQGTLLSAPGKCPVLKMAGKEQALSANTPYLMDTLEDKRLANREVRVEGTMQPDGTFQVEWLYTLHNGKLYRVRYFCNICNIEALGPGDCVCCQRPTELQEIPVTDEHK